MKTNAVAVCLPGTPLADRTSVASMGKGYRWLLVGGERLRDSHSARPSQSDVNPEDVLLFTREDASIRITVLPGKTTLHLLGPGRLQKTLDFPGTAERDAFLRSYEQQLLTTGWRLLEVSERRAGNRD